MKNVTFNEVCQVFNTVEGISSRNEMTDILSSFYQKLNKHDSQILSYLILGRVAPFFVKSEFNYSEKSFVTLLQNFLKANGSKENIVKKRKELGDIGDTLEYFNEKMKFETEDISLEEMYQTLWKIVNTTGTGSVDSKNVLIMDTLKRISPLEAKYFSRIVCGSIRLGVNARTLLDVFSFVVQGDKGIREDLDRAYGAYVDIGYICSLIKDTDGKDTGKILENVKIQPGIPILSRLVERVPSFEEVFERLGDSVLVQSKYDGLRCQIHKFQREDLKKKELIWTEYIKEEENGSLFHELVSESEVRLFTRNLEDVTEMFPEVAEEAKSIKKESFILDSEVLGWNPKNGKFLTFQETMQRRRKYNVSNIREDIPVKAMAFDILYLDGQDLSQKDTEERVEILRTLKTGDNIDIDETKDVKNIEELHTVFDDSVNKGHEGIVVKQKEGPYRPGVRNFEWLKLKKSMMSKLVDTIDLVAVGYSYGSGRRRDLGVGAVLGAVYDEKNDSFQAICNVGTGFSDEQLRDIFKSLEKDILKEKPKNIFVEKNLGVDVWVEPRVVFTVEADEITKKKGSKFPSLRFPRLVEWNRDKGVTEATSVRELEEIYRVQKKVEKSKENI